MNNMRKSGINRMRGITEMHCEPEFIEKVLDRLKKLVPALPLIAEKDLTLQMDAYTAGMNFKILDDPNWINAAQEELGALDMDPMEYAKHLRRQEYLELHKEFGGEKGT